MLQQVTREDWHGALAEAQTIECWLNCYLREFALPRQQADWSYDGSDMPASLAQGKESLLRIRFTEPGFQLCIGVGTVSRLGRCRYVSPPYLKHPGEPWRSADAAATARFLLERLAPECGFNAELLGQTRNSVKIMQQLLARAKDAPLSGDALLDAEQGMLWGHALHPTPKSREGLPLADVLAASPEARTRVRLHWFRIDPCLLRGYGRPTREALAQLAGAPDLYPCHPWEAKRLLRLPLMRKAIAQGWVEPLGAIGEPLYPTSSVRTLYHPRLDYFLKLSIHVRLTNCVRKNAWYELESAVALTALLAPVWQKVTRQVPGFDVMAEPAATTLNFSPLSRDAEALRDMSESFGILYRENLSASRRARYLPQVAGALFTTDHNGHSVCRRLIERLNKPYAPAAERWFEAYATLLLDGAWLAFFRHGVVLEPHLQNTVVGFDRNLPARVWVRDMEGIKLVDRYWQNHSLNALSTRARASVYYTRTLGWKRVAYCTLVNNLGEAIFHLAGDDARLELCLWAVVARTARSWQARHGHEPLLQGLIEGRALPSKNNLRARLFRRADRDADYTALPNPLAGLTRAWTDA